MVEMTDLPPKVLHLILVAVAASSDGARELARIGQTCKKLWPLTKNPDLLKVVNFQRLTFTVNDLMMHHHEEDLLCLSARAGNQAALVIFGKALLVNDQWFWSLVLEDNHRAFNGEIMPPEALHPHSLVRMFILHGSSKDISAMRRPLLNYVFAHVGYNAAREYGLITAIFNMCSFETGRLVLRDVMVFGSIYRLAVRVEPPYEAAYREVVINAYDKLFPRVGN